MSAELTIREGHEIRELFGSSRATWTGSAAARIGLTGNVDSEDFEALSKLGTDEDQDHAGFYQAKTAEGAAVIERLRRDRLL